MLDKKKKLIELVFEKAKKELPNGSKTSLASYLSIFFEERFGFSKDERTFVRMYKKLVEDHLDYKIDAITLDQMSCYLGFEDFKDFCNNYRNEPISQNYGPLKISISESDEHSDGFSDKLSKIIVNITNAPVFTIPEFITKHKNSLGIIGILLIGGLLANQQNLFVKNKNDDQIPIKKDNSVYQPQHIISIMPQTSQEVLSHEDKSNGLNNSKNNRVQQIRIQECMYWNNDYYEPVYCDDPERKNISIALNVDMIHSFRKITRPDTLTIENALGKVWYDKSDKKVDFFTNHGIHPINGKTLKPVTKYILEKYVSQKNYPN